MGRKNVSVILRWGGSCYVDQSAGLSYEGGRQGSIMVKTGSKFEDLVNRLHTTLGVDRRENRISVTARHLSAINPCLFFMPLNVTNDDELDVALSMVSDNDYVLNLELYVDIEPYVQQEEEAQYNTQQLQPENYTHEHGSSSQTRMTPLEAVINLVSQEPIFEAEDEDAENEQDVEDEDEEIEALDDELEQDNVDEDETSPPHELHDPGASFFHNIGDDRPAGYYVPPGLVEASQFDDKEELYKGLVFKDKDSLIVAVKNYNILRSKQYVVKNSNKKVWYVKCTKKDETGCAWRLRASVQKKHGKFEVVTYDGPHTCVYSIINEGHRQLDSDMIGTKIKSFLQDDPSFKVTAIQTVIKETFNFNISYFKAWYAKQNVIASIFGDWEGSYARLPRVLKAIQQYNPGTIVYSDTMETTRSDTVGFQRVFWAFKACIDAFVHLRPVLCIDATHMYGKYKGRLLIAQGVDANRNVLPLSFAFVNEETRDNWGWFLKLTRTHCVPNREICLISDRHAGILSAIRIRANGWQAPLGYHRYCLRHFQSNFNTKFKDSALKMLCWEAGSQTQERKFQEKMQKIRDREPAAYNWLMAEPLDKWTLAYDGGKRWGELTTNIVESFNGVLKGARSLPITACVQMVFYRCVKYFEFRREVGERIIDSGITHTDDAIKRYTRYQEKSGTHHTTLYNRRTGEASVKSRHDSTQVVLLSEKKCSCGKWTTYKIPCSHALAVCRKVSLDSLTLIDNAYSLDSHRLTYANEFHPLHHEAYWEPYVGPTWIPDQRQLRSKGRPKSTRFTNEMDVRSRSHCGICGVEGHNRKKCPTRTSQRLAGRHLE